MRKTVILILAVSVPVVGGCGKDGLTWPWSARTPDPPPAITPVPVAAPSTQPASTAVMAHVNGRAIPMDRLHELLVHGYGLAIAKQIISTEIVRRAATEKDITVSDEEVDAEHERTLKLTFPTPASDDERAQMLSQLLQSRNITRDTWRLIMLRNALLRRLVGTDFEVPDDAVGTEFRQRYGRKVVVRLP